MRVTLWGTRGSVPAPGPETARYGGNTACVSVEAADGTRLILDAGTGIRSLVAALPQMAQRVDILLTHLHLDHIQGLGFFAPLVEPGRDVHIWGPASTTLSLTDRLARYLSPPLFPVYIRDMPDLYLHEVSGDSFALGPFAIRSALVSHQDPTVGYRIEADGATVTYLPDHEPALGTADFSVGREWISGYDLAQGVDLLIHDAQYTDEEYAARVGWGHSTIRHAYQFAALAETKQLVPFHHDPTHSDDELDRLFAQENQAMQPAFKVTPGMEGMAFEPG